MFRKRQKPTIYFFRMQKQLISIAFSLANAVLSTQKATTIMQFDSLQHCFRRQKTI